MGKKRKILNLITEIRNSHSTMKDIYLFGSCLNFHCILRSVFPNSEPYYNVDHIITKIDNTYYDITGIVNPKGYLPYSTFYTKKRTSRSFKQMYFGENTSIINKNL